MKKPLVNRKDAAAVSYASEKFRQLYMAKWKSKGLSQAQFAQRVNEAMRNQGKKAECNYRYVSSWVSGAKFPQLYLKAVCEVLEVDETEFIPARSEDQYQYSTKYQDKVSTWQDDIAKKNFGLNLTLMKALKELVSFDTDFPIYTPLECVSAEPEEGYPFGLKYERMKPLEAAEADASRSLFQIRHEGKIINLSPSDMKFLKVVQDTIVGNARALFEYHQKELLFAEETAATRSRILLKPGCTVNLDEGPISPEELQKIDPYGFYTEQERKRHKIPPEPEGLPYTAAYKQGAREQIHFNPDIKPINTWLEILQAPDYDPGPAGDDNNESEKDGEKT